MCSKLLLAVVPSRKVCRRSHQQQYKANALCIERTTAVTGHVSCFFVRSVFTREASAANRCLRLYFKQTLFGSNPAPVTQLRSASDLPLLTDLHSISGPPLFNTFLFIRSRKDKSTAHLSRSKDFSNDLIHFLSRPPALRPVSARTTVLREIVFTRKC